MMEGMSTTTLQVAPIWWIFLQEALAPGGHSPSLPTTSWQLRGMGIHLNRLFVVAISPRVISSCVAVPLRCTLYVICCTAAPWTQIDYCHFTSPPVSVLCCVPLWKYKEFFFLIFQALLPQLCYCFSMCCFASAWICQNKLVPTLSWLEKKDDVAQLHCSVPLYHTNKETTLYYKYCLIQPHPQEWKERYYYVTYRIFGSIFCWPETLIWKVSCRIDGTFSFYIRQFKVSKPFWSAGNHFFKK